MHIPSELLSTPVCSVSAVAAIGGIGGAAVALARSRRAPSAIQFALVSSLVFGLQMLNYPVYNGISGHLVGGVFAAALLGVPAGVLALALVLTLQTLLFADGGAWMLGANILNMSLIGAGVGGLLRARLLGRGVASGWATGIAAAASVQLAVLALGVQLAASGRAPGAALGWLVAVHAGLAVIEGVLTVLLVKACAFSPREQASRRGYVVLAACVVACVAIAPFASGFPDAFEWTLERFDLLPEAPAFVHAPFPDYEVGRIAHERISVLAAAAIGVVAVGLAALALLAPFRRERRA